MMRLEGYIAAFQVFAKYSPDAYTGAEHDEFFVYDRRGALNPEDMQPEDVAQLEGLGWAWVSEHRAWRRFT